MSNRTYVTAAVPLGAWGDVCPETANLGIRSRHLRRIVTAMPVVFAVAGGVQDGPKAFAAEPWEVPT